MISDVSRGRLEAQGLGQQKGSKRSKSTLRNRAQISAEGPLNRMNRAIARQSSPIVVSVEQACHAGGRGFEPVAPVLEIPADQGIQLPV